MHCLRPWLQTATVHCPKLVVATTRQLTWSLVQHPHTPQTLQRLTGAFGRALTISSGFGETWEDPGECGTVAPESRWMVPRSLWLPGPQVGLFLLQTQEVYQGRIGRWEKQVLVPQRNLWIAGNMLFQIQHELKPTDAFFHGIRACVVWAVVVNGPACLFHQRTLGQKASTPHCNQVYVNCVWNSLTFSS